MADCGVSSRVLAGIVLVTVISVLSTAAITVYLNVCEGPPLEKHGRISRYAPSACIDYAHYVPSETTMFLILVCSTAILVIEAIAIPFVILVKLCRKRSSLKTLGRD